MSKAIKLLVAASMLAAMLVLPGAAAAKPATHVHENSGVVKSLDNGVLTIERADGSTVSGRVTDNTRIVIRTRRSQRADERRGCKRNKAGQNQNQQPGQNDQAQGSREGPSQQNAPQQGQAQQNNQADQGPSANRGPRGRHRGRPGTVADLTVGRSVHDARLGPDSPDGAEFTRIVLDK